MTVAVPSLLVRMAMKDFVRDWRRWTMSERVAAIIIVLGLLGLPITLAI